MRMGADPGALGASTGGQSHVTAQRTASLTGRRRVYVETVTLLQRKCMGPPSWRRLPSLLTRKPPLN